MESHLPVFTSALGSIISILHSGHYKILVFKRTNETKWLEPINYIIMHAIYQHFYELKKVVHRVCIHLVNGMVVPRISRLDPLSDSTEAIVRSYLGLKLIRRGFSSSYFFQSG